MTNPFSFEQQPCLDFLHSDTPQSNSLLANIMVKQQVGQFGSYPFNFMENDQHNEENQQSVKIEHKQRLSRPKTKQKKKVFYRDKMAQLMHQQNYVKPEYNYVDFGNYQKGHSPISRQQQLKRNRQSAKQSRQRKKQYVQTLEQRNKLNQKQITELTQRLRETELERDRLKQSHNAHVQSFNELKAQCYDKLASILDSIKPSQQKNRQLDNYITIMKQKFGCAGKQRVNLVNYHMSQIIQNLITDFLKYFINCAISDTGVFSDIKQTNQENIKKIDIQIANIIGLNEIKKISLVKVYKQRFKKQAMLFNNICQQLYQSFSMLVNQSNILENVFLDMRKDFQPEQVAMLLLYFEENKFRKDLRKMKNQWFENFKRNQDEIVDSMRKYTKKFQY